MLLFLLLLLSLLPFPPLEKGGWGGFAFRSGRHAKRKSESPAHRSLPRNQPALALALFYKVGANFRARHRQGAGLASIDPACIAIRNPRLLLFPSLEKGGWGDSLFDPVATPNAKANPPRTDHFRATNLHRRSPPFTKWAPTFARYIGKVWNLHPSTPHPSPSEVSRASQ
ncbi:hypothetical protein IEQ11_24185 [Lysobacter capsici]|uniref:hypothetical protein n=1 Tax=Lysobacter capsici TaxID=435897 RepID=UPI001783990B|nr:hypothetical protein [Lysobacter capsici]UOF14774.1 hypothetical protein IEQ11_24185 [Lysobacter capsici]